MARERSEERREQRERGWLVGVFVLMHHAHQIRRGGEAESGRGVDGVVGGGVVGGGVVGVGGIGVGVVGGCSNRGLEMHTTERTSPPRTGLYDTKVWCMCSIRYPTTTCSPLYTIYILYIYTKYTLYTSH